MAPRQIVLPPAQPPRRADPDHDLGLVRRGYCGQIDVTGELRCYLRAGHAGPCSFSVTFQLLQSSAVGG